MAETPSAIKLAQLARLLEAEELHSFVVSLSNHPDASRGQIGGEGVDAERLLALLSERLERLARGLLEEAAASDDVVDAASAEAYLEDRLAFFGELLAEEQRRRVRDLFRTAARRWG
jgi:hypothetical protein